MFILFVYFPDDTSMRHQVLTMTHNVLGLCSVWDHCYVWFPLLSPTVISLQYIKFRNKTIKTIL